MAIFECEQLELKDAYSIRYFTTADRRGCFSKVFEKDSYLELGIPFELNESFISISQKNVIRGMHFQTDNPQAKLISVLQGKIKDVIIDLRYNSPTYSKWASLELSNENHLALYVPRGFAHGFAVLEDNSIVLYQCDGKYSEDTDTGIYYNDPRIGINWDMDINNVIVSKRDLSLMSFTEFEKTYCFN